MAWRGGALSTQAFILKENLKFSVIESGGVRGVAWRGVAARFDLRSLQGDLEISI